MNTTTNNKEITSFIGNERMLKEDVVSMSDPSIFEPEFKNMHYRIKGGQSSFIALVGAPGTGKSTFFHNFLDTIEKGNNTGKPEMIKRFKFDVWEVPGRKYLWDAFVLEFARSIAPGFYKKIKNEIDGESESNTEKIAKGMSVDIGFLGLNFKELFQKTQAKRVSEYQSIFKEILKEIKENTIYITLEDIDRSGEEGVYFLETLRKFIDTYYKDDKGKKKQFVIFVPLLDTEYKDKKYRFKKVLDHILHFDELEISRRALMRNILNDILIKDYDQKMMEIRTYKDGIEKMAWALQDVSPRDLKSCIREADSICRKYAEKNKGDNLIFSFVVFLVWLNRNREQYIKESKDEHGRIVYGTEDMSVFYKFISVANKNTLEGVIPNNEKDLAELKKINLSLYSGNFHKHPSHSSILNSISGTVMKFNHKVTGYLTEQEKGVVMDEPYLSILTGGAFNK